MPSSSFSRQCCSDHRTSQRDGSGRSGDTSTSTSTSTSCVRYIREKQDEQHANDHRKQLLKQQQLKQKQLKQKLKEDEGTVQVQEMMSTIDRAASAHEYGKKLNNVATMCIAIGHYEKAIASLTKALNLSELHTVDQLLDRSEACICSDCTIDGCLSYTEHSDYASMYNDVLGIGIGIGIDIGVPKNNSNKRKTSRSSNGDDSSTVIMEDASATNHHHRHHHHLLLHRRPIRIPKRNIREGHNMGCTLFLIIMFNLALAHHLKSTKTTRNNGGTKLISSTVQLYELVTHWLHPSYQQQQGSYDDDDDDDDDEDDDDDDDDSITNSQASSARFNVILYNNLIHLKRMLMMKMEKNKTGDEDTRSNNATKKKLNELLSTITATTSTVTDDDDDDVSDASNSINNNNNGNNITTSKPQEGIPQTITSSSDIFSMGAHRLHSSRRRRRRIVSCNNHNGINDDIDADDNSNNNGSINDILQFEYFTKKEENEYYDGN